VAYESGGAGHGSDRSAGQGVPASSDVARTNAPLIGDAGAFSSQQIGGAISKLISASVGDVAVVFSRSASHKHYALADIEWMILPAVMTGQAYIAELQHKEHGARAPVAAVLWASVSAETDQRLSASLTQKLRLRPDEWKSGEILWIIDAAGEPRAIAGALAELAQTQFKDKPVKLIMPDAVGKPHIDDLHALLARAVASEARAG
jgi:hemolysin-activating ACP:hemolysin acyltransferase